MSPKPFKTSLLQVDAESRAAVRAYIEQQYPRLTVQGYLEGLIEKDSGIRIVAGNFVSATPKKAKD